MSGGYETATVDGVGYLPVTEVWDLADVDLGYFDIVVDIDEDANSLVEGFKNSKKKRDGIG